MTNRIKEAIDVFLDAINDETLAKGTCTACAVGNLIAHGMGGKIEKIGPHFKTIIHWIMDNNYFSGKIILNSDWSNAFVTNYNGKQTVYKQNLNNPVFNYSKFTPEELMQIEYAFETNTKIMYYDYDLYGKNEVKHDQINGLHAVIEVMKKFDNVEFSTKEEFTNKVIYEMV